MKNIYSKIALLLMGILLLIGCENPSPQASSSQEKIAKSFRTNNKYSNIYLYSVNFLVPVIVNDQLIGRLDQKTFILKKVKPGTYNISFYLAPSYLHKTITVTANKNYFVGYRQETTWSGEKQNVEQLSTVAGKKIISKMKMLQPTQAKASLTKEKVNYKATKVSPAKYRQYSCKQLENKIISINSNLSGLVKMDNEAKTMSAISGVASLGTVALGASSSSQPYIHDRVGVISKPQTVVPMAPYLKATNSNIPSKISSLLGQYNAMATVAKEKKCGFASKLK